MDRITTLFVQFSELGTIRKWSTEAFEGATEYQIVTRGWFCVIDGPEDADPTCVLDDGRPQDCIYAKPGMCREQCEYWQSIPVPTPTTDSSAFTPPERARFP